MTCFEEDGFMLGDANHPLILLLFTPEKDKDNARFLGMHF